MADTAQKNWRLPNALLGELDRARTALKQQIGHQVAERDAVEAGLLMWARADTETQANWVATARTLDLEPITRPDAAVRKAAEQRPKLRRRRKGPAST